MKNRNHNSKRGLALFLALAMCLGMIQTTAMAADEITDSEGTDVPKAQVTITVENENVNVEGRPEADASKAGEQGYEGTVETEDGSTVTVDGTVISTPDVPQTDPEHDDRVTQESGSTETSETVTIETPEKDVTPEDQKGEPTPEPVEDEDVPDDIPYEENETDLVDGKTEINVDINELVGILMPEKPDGADADDSAWEETDAGYSKTEGGFTVNEAGIETGTKTETSWSVQPTGDADSKTGWVTTKTETVTVKGELTGDALDWTAPEGATPNGNGTYTVTSVSEPDENGTVITTTTIYNPATGTYERTTTTTTTETVTLEQTESGEIKVKGSTSVGEGDGHLSEVSSLGPVERKLDDKTLKQLSRSSVVSKFNNGELSVLDVAAWARLNGTKAPINHLLWTSDKDAEQTGELSFISHGINSTVKINFAVGGTEKAPSAWLRQYETEDGDTIWVYCAQKGLDDWKGVGYEMVNVGDINYYAISEEDAKHIQYIAEHGYWATESGTGSLDAVKNLLTTENIDAAGRLSYDASVSAWKGKTWASGFSRPTTEEGVLNAYKNALDEGLVLAVTQAAIWYYAHPEIRGDFYAKDGEDFKNIFTTCWTQGDGHKDGRLDYIGMTSGGKLYYHPEMEAAMALFKVLIAEDMTSEELNGQLKETTDIISKEDITGTSISVTGKADEAKVSELVKELEEKAKAEASEDALDESGFGTISNIYNSNGSYQTTISVTVAVVPDRMFGDDMTVYVYVDGVVDSKGMPIPVASKKLVDGTKGTDNITLDISAVLPQGVNVTLNLKGTQELKEGAYLFRSDIDYSEAQTMVGYISEAGATRDVNLKVDMQFEVTDPEVSKTTEVTMTQTVSEVQERSWSESWTQSYQYNDPGNPPRRLPRIPLRILTPILLPIPIPRLPPPRSPRRSLPGRARRGARARGARGA